MRIKSGGKERLNENLCYHPLKKGNNLKNKCTNIFNIRTLTHILENDILKKRYHF